MILFRTLAAPLALVILSPLPAAADAVVASDRVERRVIVRERADAGSRDVGSLRPGERAEHLGSVSNWHRIRLADDTQGFVSAAWTRVVPEAPAQARARKAHVVMTPVEPSLLGSVATSLKTLFGNEPRVDITIREPGLGRSLYRHFDPNLPVSGFATASGRDDRYDIMLVIDASTSTNEYAQADVNGDARYEAEWKGSDSVYEAQLIAARNFVRTLRRLPGNHAGERIRLGLVTFAGGEEFYLRPQDADFRPSRGEIQRLAARDAEIQMPLTSDYAAVERKLAELSQVEPVGMTNVAAGIGRAIIELRGLEDEGSQSRPRPGAQKVILFLSDGEPRLPFERVKAEETAVYAAEVAAQGEIRINAFALGHNVVTRVVNASVKTMATKTQGSFVALENPADITSILRATSFAYVDKVKLINRTTGYETRYVTTGIDGSFYGEIALAEGENEIEVVAQLFDGEEASKRFRIEYEFLPPTRELVLTLEKIRKENEALIDQIKEKLAREMGASRPGQDKHLEVSAGPED